MLLGYILHHTRGQAVRVDPVVNLVLWQVVFLTLSKLHLRLPSLLPLQLSMGSMISDKATLRPCSWLRPTMPSSGLLGALLLPGSSSHAQRWCDMVFAVTGFFTQGYGGPVNSLLSWGLFAPLARLTYCCYLIHQEILAMFTLSTLSFFPSDVSHGKLF